VPVGSLKRAILFTFAYNLNERILLPLAYHLAHY
jgi:hypothetical protein